jgi:hypothetical protein
MKRARKAPDVPLNQLRLADLLRTPTPSGGRKVVNLKVPADTLYRVHELARRLGVPKAAAVVAVLNEGLQVVYRRAARPRR